MNWFSLSLFGKRRSAKRTTKRPAPRTHLQIEALEERALMASNCLAPVSLDLYADPSATEAEAVTAVWTEPVRMPDAVGAGLLPASSDTIVIGGAPGADLFGAASITAVGQTTETVAALGDAALANVEITYWELGTLTAPQAYSQGMTEVRDLYRFTMNGPGAASNYVGIDFWHSDGDLDLYLYDANLNVLAYSAGQTNGEAISINGLAAGSYFVGVELYGFGVASQNYILTIDPGVASVPTTPAPSEPPPASPTPPPAPAGGFNITLQLNGFTPSQVAIFNQAAARWQEIVTGDLADVTFNGQLIDDLVIDARGVYIDGVNGTLGRAGPTYVRTDSRLPLAGIMEFDTADLAALERDNQLYPTILHEMGHVLGIGTLWEQFGLVVGLGGNDPRYVGANATAYYNAIFGVNENSVPVANVGAVGGGSYGGHWRESVFYNELLSPNLNYGIANPLSAITVASLADMGYMVNINAADAYAPPAFAGVVAAASETDSSDESGAGSESSALVAAAADTMPLANLLEALASTDSFLGAASEWSALGAAAANTTSLASLLETLATNLSPEAEAITHAEAVDAVFAEDYRPAVTSDGQMPLGPQTTGRSDSARGFLRWAPLHAEGQPDWEGMDLAMRRFFEMWNSPPAM